MSKPDLNKLKTEIANRKNEKTMTIDGVAPRDKFLYGLIESLNTGRESQSTTLVKTVDNTVAAKKKETARLPINEVMPVQTLPVQKPAVVDMSPERDEQLWIEMERRRKQTLTESMQSYVQSPTVNAPMGNNMTKQMSLNEQYLTENVKGIVNNYLVENFGPIVEEAIKSTILELYAVERIKDVLTENKEIIKTVVYETIRELQTKSKTKVQ
jgi:hypothetical protein